MRKGKCPIKKFGEKGAITPILAVGMVAMLGILALGIDLGQLFLAKGELQNIADAAALAGARKLVQAKDPANPQVAGVYCDEALAAAQACVQENRSLGEQITLGAGDVVYGKWNLQTGTFDSQGCSADPMQVNAVQVTVRRGEGGTNPPITTFFAGIFGATSLNSQATAVAYLGLAGSSALNLPFAVPTSWPGGGGPYAAAPVPGWLSWLTPAPAQATDPQVYTWKDLGGTSLDTSRATFAMPKESEKSDYTRLQKYNLGPPNGFQYPQVVVGQKLYPLSEYRWPSILYTNFKNLKIRFGGSDGVAKVTGRWRMTVAVYSTTPVTAGLPQNPWLALAARFLPWPTPAYACQSYSSPVVYVQGFASADVTEVNCDKNCQNYSYTDSRSCRNTCYVKFEVPLSQNTVSTDKTSNPIPYQRDYRDMNPAASEVGVFAGVPRLVK
ncbi:MAG: pilus assembly protein TadG-related protein [Thermodesulfobacteriota bacterium]